MKLLRLYCQSTLNTTLATTHTATTAAHDMLHIRKTALIFRLAAEAFKEVVDCRTFHFSFHLYSSSGKAPKNLELAPVFQSVNGRTLSWLPVGHRASLSPLLYKSLFA